MNRLITLSLLMGLVVLPIGIVQANELNNASFETAPPNTGAGNWNTFAGGDGGGAAAWVTDAANAHDGSSFMAFELNGANAFAGVYQPVVTPVSGGDIVTLTGWHKSLVNPFAAVRELKLEWHGNPQLRVDTFEIGADYEQFSLQGVAPPGTTGVTATYAISSFTTDHQGAALVYLDDLNLTIERVPEPTSMMLVLGGVFSLFGLIRRR